MAIVTYPTHIGDTNAVALIGRVDLSPLVGHASVTALHTVDGIGYFDDYFSDEFE